MHASVLGRSLETGRNGGQSPEKLFWKETERQEGLARNVLVSAFDRDVIAECIGYPGRYGRPASLSDAPASEVVKRTPARIRSQHAVSNA
jgi:hypothetical protein